ncbi:hypothetical protein G7075_09095 [Phycicoccus sp. HDW14]|nr:hypothetical protein G7075_09095 [Phycicoccus sp. HDW14]
MFAGLVGRLGQVQLVGAAGFTAEASTLDTRTLVVPALRGRILDRAGRVLADNRVSTVVTLERRVIADDRPRAEDEVRSVATVLGLDADDLLARTHLCGEPGAPAAPACWSGSAQVPVPLATDVDPARALTLVEQPDRFPGVAVESAPVRVYPGPRVPGPPRCSATSGRPHPPTSPPTPRWPPTTSSGGPGSSSSTTASCAGPRAAPSSPSTRAASSRASSRAPSPCPAATSSPPSTPSSRPRPSGRSRPRWRRPARAAGPPTPEPSSSSTRARAPSRPWPVPPATTPTCGRAASRPPTTPRSPTRERGRRCCRGPPTSGSRRRAR